MKNLTSSRVDFFLNYIKVFCYFITKVDHKSFRDLAMRHLERDKLNGGSVKKGERNTNHLHVFFL